MSLSDWAEWLVGQWSKSSHKDNDTGDEPWVYGCTGFPQHNNKKQSHNGIAYCHKNQKSASSSNEHLVNMD